MRMVLFRTVRVALVIRAITSRQSDFKRRCSSVSRLVKINEFGVYRVAQPTQHRSNSSGNLSALRKFYNRWKSVMSVISDKFRKMADIHQTPFTPPESVRGMKSLDRTAFDMVVNVPGIKVPIKAVASVSKRFKKLLLKMPKVKPIVELGEDDPENVSHKLFLFDPCKVKSAAEFVENNRDFLLNNNVLIESYQQYEITLTYENWTYDEVLDAILPKDSDSVGGFSTVGHIAHLNLRDHLLDYKFIIGQVILDKLSSVQTVVNKTQTIDNTYRNFQMEVLAGEPNFITIAREHGFMYKLDFSKVYWNSRLGTEHQRLVESIKQGDILYDVFAGVGPFAVPAAKKGSIVLANDLNPESFKWLKHNVELNKIAEKVKTSNLDGRDFIKSVLGPDLLSRWKDGYQSGNLHVVMNLPAMAVDFLNEFIGLILSVDCVDSTSVKLPMIHCYCFSRSTDPIADAGERTCSALGLSKFEDLTDRNVRIVRNVAPGKEMLCVSFRLPLSVLIKTEPVLCVDASAEPISKRKKTTDE